MNPFENPPIHRPDLERILHPLRPRDMNLYWAALTHASAYNSISEYPPDSIHSFYKHGHPIFGNNFEKLEFLGDSIIHACLASILIRLFPTRDEGFLSRVRIGVEQKSGLAELCRKVGLVEFIKKDPAIPYTDDMLENIFEGFVGALFEDQQLFLSCGIQKCTDFIWRTLKARFDNVLHELRVDNNFKDFVVRLKAKRVLESLNWKHTSVKSPTTGKIVHTAELVCTFSNERIEYFKQHHRETNLLETIQSVPVVHTLTRTVRKSAKTISEAEQAASRDLLELLQIQMQLI